MYLGFPLISGRMSSQQFYYLEEKVRRKLGIWQSKLLSRAAKLLLIQSVCSTIPTYAMQVCKLPARTLAALEKIHRNFFWGDTEELKSTHVVSWGQICQPRGMGGLGLRSLLRTNVTMLAKLTWRFMTQREALWRIILRAKYGVTAWGVVPLHCADGSIIWQGVKIGYALMATCIEWDNGELPSTPRWTLTSSGVFSTKSLYDHLCASGINSDPFPWLAIWQMAGPPRYSLTLWTLAHDRLKTRALLWNLCILDTSECPRCGASMETALHAVRDCREVRRMW